MNKDISKVKVGDVIVRLPNTGFQNEGVLTVSNIQPCGATICDWKDGCCRLAVSFKEFEGKEDNGRCLEYYQFVKKKIKRQPRTDWLKIIPK